MNYDIVCCGECIISFFKLEKRSKNISIINIWLKIIVMLIILRVDLL